MKCLVSVILLIAMVIAAVSAQYGDGPVPPRINVPGAIPLGVLRPGGGGPSGIPTNAFRTDRVPGPVLVRTRRPLIKGRLSNALPNASPSPVQLEEAKPVTEEPEEGEHFTPQLIQSQPAPPPSPIAPQPKFFEPNSLGEDDGPLLPRFQAQERPTPVPVQLARFVPQPQIQQQPKLSRPQFRPEHRPAPQQLFDSEEPVRHREAPAARPTPRYNNVPNQVERERKPVAQILRKYREEHEDGTITWGFENDDGSFKEETIGIDCVTRGRYGYVDPDGVKREYAYETGNLCDPSKRDQEEEEEELENEYVPNQNVKQFKRPQLRNN